jgi:hypothetical protein
MLCEVEASYFTELTYNNNDCIVNKNLRRNGRRSHKRGEKRDDGPGQESGNKDNAPFEAQEKETQRALRSAEIRLRMRTTIPPFRRMAFPGTKRETRMGGTGGIALTRIGLGNTVGAH